MERHGIQTVLNKLVNKNWTKIGLSAFMAASVFIVPTAAIDTSLDGERLNLETQMQRRVEEALSKMLESWQFVVVIRVEPIAKITATKEAAPDDTDGFFLPGVPSNKRMDGSADAIRKLTDQLRPDKEVYHRFIKRITVTLVLDKSVTPELVTKVRDLTRQMIGLDPGRGDTLDIQQTSFPKPATATVVVDNTGISKLQQRLRDYSLLIGLSLLLFCVVVFFLFIFGPLRGFLNRLVQILPTLKPVDNGDRGRFGDSTILPALMAQSLGLPGPGGGGGGGPANFSGSLQVENPNKRTTPFGFIREDHLSNLGVLLSRETPEKAAVVLGYLPTDWIIKVLSKMEPMAQTEVTNHLATTRQLLPEQVEDIEQDLKRRLDYLIGGPDRIYSVYESLDPEAQRRMLENLKITRPDMADELRRRTFLFEDLEKMEVSSMKAVLREVDLQTLVMSLKGMPEDFISKILEHLSEGKAEIVKQELELSDAKPGKATLEAQRKIAMIARRLEKEGQVEIAQIDDSAPQTRYGPSLRSTIKLPPGLAIRESEKTPTEEGQVVEVDNSIQDRIRRFMGRKSGDQRFPGSSK